jgi:protein-tyrosine phosphatase
MSQVETYHILFVCMGNICRSPSGENVMRQVAESAGVADRFHLDSAGTISMHTGNPPDARMGKALNRRGFPTTGEARQVRTEDLEAFDLILAMDNDNLDYLRDLQSRRPDAERLARIQLFCDFCRRHEEDEVPDPYYGGAEGFERVIDLLEDGCAGILELWQQGQLPGR